MSVVPLRGLPDQDRLPPSGSELRRAIGSCRQAFIGVALMSGMINLLYLTGSFFMLEVYDRVLPSRSVPTLVGLLVIAAVLYVFQGLLDICRGRVLTRIGGSLDERLHERVYDVLIRQPLKKRTTGDGLQAIRDLDQIRQFLSGIGPTALFDLPWMPLYLAICFLFHPWIGATAVAGALVLVAITLATEWRTRQPTKTASESATTRNALALASRRNAEVLQAMGMGRRTGALWSAANERFIEAQQRSSDVAGGLGAVSKVMRMALQSAILGVGAYLVIEQQATAGVIIASSILTSRALAPVELAIANWRGFVAARQSWKRLRELFAALPEQAHPLALPQPSVSLSVEGASAIPPGGQRFVLQDASFSLKAGNGLGVIGPSASGKSSLARLLVGVWAPVRGKVRLDGAALDQWAPDAIGPHIGYLPQDVELFAGTVAENIARFDPDRKPDAVIAAARAANVHDLILRLPDGYETQIGEAGTALSAGQCQRIALARALYGDPFLIVLDEPNSNLDAEGEQALTQAILSARARGRIVVVIAHRPSALAAVDLVLVMADGRTQAFGLKDEVLSKVLRRGGGPGSAAPAQPAHATAGGTVLKVVESQRAAS
jgi:PrtD family type I secretion system ABC transporter